MTETKPLRLQLSRRKGFNLQAASRAANGLDAVNCSRPSVLGNPFVVGRPSGVFPEGCGHQGRAETLIPSVTRKQSVDMFEELFGGFIKPEMYPHGHKWMARFKKSKGESHPETYARARLRNHNLACFCHLCPAHASGKALGVVCAECDPCHVDPLLEIANR
jgi:hypothetical protein